jgi:hypothetical protein
MAGLVPAISTNSGRSADGRDNRAGHPRLRCQHEDTT